MCSYWCNDNFGSVGGRCNRIEFSGVGCVNVGRTRLVVLVIGVTRIVGCAEGRRNGCVGIGTEASG